MRRRVAAALLPVLVVTALAAETGDAAASAPARVDKPSTIVRDGRVTVKWARPATGGAAIQDYDVRVRRVGGTWSRRDGAQDRTVRSLLVKGLKNYKLYEVQVRAENRKGEGQWSPARRFTPRPLKFPTRDLSEKLPTGKKCAQWVRSRKEHRPENRVANRTKGTSPHDVVPRVKGNFTGTTDEILQWGACKWGLSEDTVRATAAIESWWFQSNRGDYTSDPQYCHPRMRDESPCAESVGIYQVRFQFHSEAFENANAIDSTAYNVDYGLSVWRRCYEGEFEWLNTVERGKRYVPGDARGCLGVWFSGRWYTPAAVDYIDRLFGFRRDRVWAQPFF